MTFSKAIIIITLVILNLAAGLGFAIPLTNRLCEIKGQNNFWKFYAVMLGIYFLEGVAFGAGMCTQVFTIGLSFVWGFIFAKLFKGIVTIDKIIKQIILISLYGCLPTISFSVIITVFWILSGNGLLNVEQAYNFGIPDFLPFPLNTVLGFCVALAAGTIILKTVCAAGITSMIARKD